MKIVINADWGGFVVPQEVRKIFELEGLPTCVRTDPRFVAWVETHAGESDLAIAEIPDVATDWMIQSYDGMESVLYVIDGKILSTGGGE